MPERCAACQRTLVAQTAWAAADKADRIVLRAAGYVPSAGRGLCKHCYQVSSKHGDLERYPRLSRSSNDVVEDWNVVSISQNRADSRASRIREAAPRLGMTPDALERALDRMGAAS